jgi:hypothetical protein
MFIYPAQVSEIAQAFSEIEKMVAVVDRVGDRDILTLKMVAAKDASASEEFTRRVEEKAREILKLRAEVEPVDDIDEEKLILDVRKWD